VRVYNFSAGPAMLPTPVLETARAELLDWQGSGMSVMEISHRGRAFGEVAAHAERDLRDLLGIPDHYRVLFLAGGATLQFSCIPLNLAPPGSRVDYVRTGAWSLKASQEAARTHDMHVVADGVAGRYTDVPPEAGWQRSPNAAYLHYCVNETIHGVEFPFVPESGDVPLVADVSSTILSRPLDVSRFGLLYAGAQKNIGPSGITIVIVREDLLGRSKTPMAPILDYAVAAREGSMLNTPPTFAWYLAGLVFRWLKAEGGLAEIGRRNAEKAACLYDYIDASGYYASPVARAARSRMNVPFTLPRAELEAPFVREAAESGLTNLEGHRSVGGLRASLYNAMPVAGVRALVDFMRDFAARHPSIP
jgi:phosphoserine aminotransferase